MSYGGATEIVFKVSWLMDYFSELLSGKIETGHQGEASVQLPISACQS